jgi:hypothetical protein
LTTGRLTTGRLTTGRLTTGRLVERTCATGALNVGAWTAGYVRDGLVRGVDGVGVRLADGGRSGDGAGLAAGRDVAVAGKGSGLGGRVAAEARLPVPARMLQAASITLKCSRRTTTQSVYER